MKKVNLLKIGNFIGDLFLIQFYFLIYSLRGGLVLGVFPSFIATIKVLSDIFYNDNPDIIKHEFKNTYKEHFKRANQVGYIIVIIIIILILDYIVYNNILENAFTKIITGIVILLSLVIITHIPIVILRFNVSLKDTFKQALHLSLASPLETFSIIISLLVLEIFFSRFPLLLIFIGASIIGLPFSWFSYNSVEKIKSKID